MYIKDSLCISPQPSFPNGFLSDGIIEHEGIRFHAQEPNYTDVIPAGLLRRMGKAVRMGVGGGMKLLHRNEPVNAIIIGTANGGLEDCIKFLNQIVEYNEGTLTPTNFVQSTPNAIGGQLALLTTNRGYNITHTHNGHSFENALIDAQMLLEEEKVERILVGGIEEISDYNHHIDWLANYFKKESVTSSTLLSSGTIGTVNGEGASLFILERQPSLPIQVCIKGIHTFLSPNQASIQSHLADFLANLQVPKAEIDGYLLGLNGDIEEDAYYQSFLSDDINLYAFKHTTGDYPTANAFGVWLANELLLHKSPPKAYTLSEASISKPLTRLLLYNHFRGVQHSFILLERYQSR